MNRYALATVICFALGIASARASGTVVIHQTGGHVDTYSNVSIKLAGNALFLRSADKKGTLVIPRAACSYRGSVLACYPTTATLVQGGDAGDLVVKTGAVYVNLTGSAQTPAGSTTPIPAHSISLSFRTHDGTYVTSAGRIDEVEQ
ncbi:MAG TPA: hypothetical protein VK760_12435 [Candidatus Acidoferrales bacterium]|jgi:hypothetical protein|nr:hypothetical protein [Candidatus Acidoferrales bacterium]